MFSLEQPHKVKTGAPDCVLLINKNICYFTSTGTVSSTYSHELNTAWTAREEKQYSLRINLPHNFRSELQICKGGGGGGGGGGGRQR